MIYHDQWGFFNISANFQARQDPDCAAATAFLPSESQQIQIFNNLKE